MHVGNWLVFFVGISIRLVDTESVQVHSGKIFSRCQFWIFVACLLVGVLYGEESRRTFVGEENM